MSGSAGDRLDSWKEIAAHLGRSVRTVRRWEAEEGLPVHRQMHRAGGNVYAFRSELDAWRGDEHRARPPRRFPAAPGRRTAPAGASESSIVVLPLTNLSPDPENEYFADGLTDEIIVDLSKVGALRVISRTSSMALKGSKKDAGTMARELGVRYLLEGSVRRSGDRLRISARLIDAESDAPIWSERYDGELGDVFAIQERLARTIVEALELHLTPSEDERLGQRRIGDARAYECYLQARQESLRWRADAIDHAVQLLRNGLSIVGDDVTLEAALGRAHLQYREAGIDFSDAPLRRAEECARRLFALDAASAAGFQLQAWIAYARGDVQGAVRDLRRALELDPHDPDTLALLANCLLISGRVPDARPLIERLLAVDPLTPLTRCLPGWADLLEGKLEQAVEPYRAMFEMDPGNPMGRLFYVWVLALNQRGEEVARLAAAIPAPVRDSIAGRMTALLAGAAAGRPAEALAELTPELEEAARATELFARFLAEGYALAGMPDEAVEWLGIAVDRGFINYPFLAEHDPFFSRLEENSAFQSIMGLVRQRWEGFEA